MVTELNLNNEVVKMRAEVKRVKVLVFRKLTRQIAALRKMKGPEAKLEKNERRAARLLEEIRELKSLVPDTVTKAALQSDISFKEVCKNKNASLSERATARIATHPEFSRKIQSIKAAVEAFKAERMAAAAAKRTKKANVEEKQPESEDKAENEDEAESEDEAEDDKKEEPEELKEENQVQINDEGSADIIKQDKPITEKEESSASASTPPEVTRMRKEVKTLRVLIIRKLTKQIRTLKRAKAKESELQGNRECVARLQKEIIALRELSHDQVTRRALEGDIDLEKIFQDPESSPVERATARIATHPQFVKKFLDVQVAIAEEMSKAAKVEQDKSIQVKDHEVIQKGNITSDEEEDGDEDEEEEGDEDEVEDGDEVEDVVEMDLGDHDDESDSHDAEEAEDINSSVKRLNIVQTQDVNASKPNNEKSEPVIKKSESKKEKAEPKKTDGVPNRPANAECGTVSVKPKVVQKPPTKTKEVAPSTKHDLKVAASKSAPATKEHSESDLSDVDEEKEYFDDSTEERFNKQSSYSEQSDDDDFFLGKVSKLKKKKGDGSHVASRRKPTDSKKTDARDSSQFKMQSVFCPTLSKSSGAPQNRKPGHPKPVHFQNHSQHSDRKPSWFKRQDSETKDQPSRNQVSGFRNQEFRPKGPARDKMGKAAFERPGNEHGRHSQQNLHPSWEASKRRKEQQAQITAFQGKKIKFDDDD